MKKLLLLLSIVSMSALASPLDNLSVYGGLGFGGKLKVSETSNADNATINLGTRYLFTINESFSVGPFVDYMSKTEYGGINHTISGGVSGKYQHKSGVYGLRPLANSVDLSNEDSSFKTEANQQSLGPLGMQLTQVSVEGSYATSSFKIKQGDGSKRTRRINIQLGCRIQLLILRSAHPQ